MKSFNQIRQYITEQDVPQPKQPEPEIVPMSQDLQLSIDPLDLEVVYAFFRGEPDVVGTNFITKQNDDEDYTVNDLRIDLLWGRAKEGVALWHEDIITFATPGIMIDDNAGVKKLQAIIKNMARAKDIRTMW